MSDFKVGDRVRVLSYGGNVMPEVGLELPAGTEGTVREVVEGCGVFFEADADTIKYPLHQLGEGWPLEFGEIELVSVDA